MIVMFRGLSVGSAAVHGSRNVGNSNTYKCLCIHTSQVGVLVVSGSYVGSQLSLLSNHGSWGDGILCKRHGGLGRPVDGRSPIFPPWTNGAHPGAIRA